MAFLHVHKNIADLPTKTLEYNVVNFNQNKPTQGIDSTEELIRRYQNGTVDKKLLDKLARVQNQCGKRIQEHLMSMKEPNQLEKESLSEDPGIALPAKREILKRSSIGDLIKATTTYSGSEDDWHCREAATELVRRARESLTSEIREAFSSITGITRNLSACLPSILIVKSFLEEINSQH